MTVTDVDVDNLDTFDWVNNFGETYLHLMHAASTSEVTLFAEAFHVWRKRNPEQFQEALRTHKIRQKQQEMRTALDSSLDKLKVRERKLQESLKDTQDSIRAVLIAKDMWGLVKDMA